MEYKTATAFEVSSRLGAIIGGGTEDQIVALSEYGRNIGIAYQIRDDLIDWKNEDKLFNLLVKKSMDPRDIFNHMEKMLKDYAEKAASSLRIIPDNDAKSHLEYLLRLTTLKL
jgi:octaprenyl-diphosphate synthase